MTMRLLDKNIKLKNGILKRLFFSEYKVIIEYKNFILIIFMIVV